MMPSKLKMSEYWPKSDGLSVRMMTTPVIQPSAATP
jgi:hypothetical protein